MKQSILDKTLIIRNEKVIHANTKGRMADVLDELNEFKADLVDGMIPSEQLPKSESINLQSVLDTGSEATLIPSIDIQAGEFEIKADGMNAPNSISINKGGYTVDISSRSGGVNVTSSGGDIVLENFNSGINLYAKGFIDIKSPESTIGLEAKYVYIDSKGALNFNSVQSTNFQSQQGFNITSRTGISIFSETSSAVVVGNSTGFISVDTNLNLYLPTESIGITSETDYTSNYPTDGTEDTIFPQIRYIKDNFCEEAPQDGNFYVRQNGVWVDVTNKLNP